MAKDTVTTFFFFLKCLSFSAKDLLQKLKEKLKEIPIGNFPIGICPKIFKFEKFPIGILFPYRKNPS